MATLIANADAMLAFPAELSTAPLADAENQVRTGWTIRFVCTTIRAVLFKGVSACAETSGHLFSYLSPEQRVPADHPLRTIRTMTDEAFAGCRRRCSCQRGWKSWRSVRFWFH